MSCINTTVTPPAGSAAGAAPAVGIVFSMAVGGSVTVTWAADGSGAQCLMSGGCVTWQVVNAAGTGVIVKSVGPNSGSKTFSLPVGDYTLRVATQYRYDSIGGGVPPYAAVPVQIALTGACSTSAPAPKPTGLHVVSTTETSVSLACNDMGAGLQYAWFNGTARVGDFTTTPSTVVSDLAPGTTYTLGCASLYPGEQPWSALATVTAKTTAVPSCPSCPSCSHCTDPVVGCVPITCPSGQTCVNNVCTGPGTTGPGPSPPANHDLEIAAGGALALIGAWYLVARHRAAA